MTNDKLPNPSDLPCYDVIIIGSGIAGLTAGRIVKQAGKSLLVLDKGRRIGGRCSTKRGDGITANHGAQFFTCQDPEFTALTQEAHKAGAVQLWDFGHHKPCYIGAPTMRDFPQFLAKQADLDVRQSVTITSIQKQDTKTYHLTDSDGHSYHCRQLIITAPAPQAALLVAPLDEALAATAKSAHYDPCWTVMLGLDKPLEMPQAPLREAGLIGWANYEPSRLLGDEASTYQPALTIQATPQASHDMLDWPKEDVIGALQTAYEQITGRKLSVTNALAHRWLYARIATAAASEGPFISEDNSLALAGDYFGNARLESAFISGRRAAQALSALL